MSQSQAELLPTVVLVKRGDAFSKPESSELEQLG